jgi:DNA-binding XRE family transcriptional regulator
LKEKPKIKVKDLVVFGKHLRALRESKGISQETLGLNIGSYQSTIIRIEQGKSNPKLMTLIEIAKSLKIPVKDLFDF